MKVSKQFLTVVIIYLVSTLFVMGQSKIFPSKYDFKPVVQLTGNNNTIDRGVLYAFEDDLIVIQSFSDMKLYGYQLDSIAKIKLRKGPGFLKVGTPVFITFSTLLIGVDLYAITLGAGIEMIPASAFIPIIALPAAVIAGTIGYIASTNKEYEVNAESMGELKTKLYQYSFTIK